MAFRSQADFVDQVLDNLGLLPTGQTAETEDIGKIVKILPSVFDLLNAAEVVSIPDPNNIPGEFFLPLSHCVAFYCKQPFGLVGDAAAGVDNDYQLALLQFRVMNRGRPTGETMQSDSF